ncbi:MAG: NAD(P)H-hydrate dehydratase [Chloroflexota bacterium]|nr:NAD(P)H-hydrate dehydratase [Chloroflexota bacterium]
MKIVTAEAMRALERRAVENEGSLDDLMERAGHLSARVAWGMLQDAEADDGPAARISHAAAVMSAFAANSAAAPPRVLVLIGPGNNGGDGLVAARHLQLWLGGVSAIILAGRAGDDPKRQLALDAGVTVVGAEDDPVGTLERTLPTADIVVDAVLGIGASRPLEGAIRDSMALVNAERARRPALQTLALDVPTGIDADSGEADANALDADATVTFGFPKHGHFRFPAAARAGRLVVADIGVPDELASDIGEEAVTTAWAQAQLPRRPLDAHKGSFGRVLALAGSRSYVGAAQLACLGAARSGAGYITLAVTPAVQALVVPRLTESTFLLLPDEGDGDADFEAVGLLRGTMPACDALLVGCGLGQHDTTRLLLDRLLLSSEPVPLPTVIDADALNFLATVDRWWERLRADAVLTPHPGEMARLLKCGIGDVEADRIATARRAATAWGVTVLLKGAFTVAASPDGRVRVLPFANPALATAGTGDVLAGCVAGLLAQGLGTFDAATLGAFLHAAAGELAAEAVGEAGVIAGDLLPLLPLAITELREGSFTGGIRHIA